MTSSKRARFGTESAATWPCKAGVCHFATRGQPHRGFAHGPPRSWSLGGASETFLCCMLLLLEPVAGSAVTAAAIVAQASSSANRQHSRAVWCLTVLVASLSNDACSGHLRFVLSTGSCIRSGHFSTSFCACLSAPAWGSRAASCAHVLFAGTAASALRLIRFFREPPL